MYMKKEEKKAVSPVIAVILMVAITVVLAAVLFVMVQQYTQQQQGIEISLGVREGASNSTHWVIAIDSGEADKTDVNFQLQKGGILQTGYSVTADAAQSTGYADGNIVWIDNDGNDKLNSGDSILVKKGTLTAGDYTFKAIKGGSPIITIELTKT